MHKTVMSHLKNQRGAVLIDLTVMLLISGILIGGAIQFSEFFAQRERALRTEARMEVIINALSNYAQTRWRLPCPAEPDSGSGAYVAPFGTERATCGAVAGDVHGIVPYRTLGLPEYYAKDAYGNFMTYIVSAAFTGNNEIVAGGPGSNPVQRRQAYALEAGNDGLIPKAKFCGAGAGAALDLEQGGQSPLLAARNTVTLDAQNLAAGPPDVNLYREDPVTTLAMALVSHGPNGFGAYRPDGTNDCTEGGNTEQATCGQNNIVRLERDVNRAGGGNEFDDVVVIMTQEQIYAEAGGGSCEAP